MQKTIKLTSAQWCLIDAINCLGSCTLDEIVTEIKLRSKHSVRMALAGAIRKGIVTFDTDGQFYEITVLGARSYCKTNEQLAKKYSHVQPH